MNGAINISKRLEPQQLPRGGRIHIVGTLSTIQGCTRRTQSLLKTKRCSVLLACTAVKNICRVAELANWDEL